MIENGPLKTGIQAPALIRNKMLLKKIAYLKIHSKSISRMPMESLMGQKNSICRRILQTKNNFNLFFYSKDVQ